MNDNLGMTVGSAADLIDGGFADPVLQAQSVFRAIMVAMAEPATVHHFDPGTTPPKPLSPMAAAIACTLTDADTPVWLDAALGESEAVRNWLAFQTAAPLTSNPLKAHFALVSDPAAIPALDGFGAGSQEYPDRSTTVILQVATLEDGDELIFTGPGIRDRARIAPDPMPLHFSHQWAANRARFPRGIDLILAAPGALACLPRTARVMEEEA